MGVVIYQIERFGWCFLLTLLGGQSGQTDCAHPNKMAAKNTYSKIARKTKQNTPVMIDKIHPSNKWQAKEYMIVIVFLM